MKEYSLQNKKAWEFSAYNLGIEHVGTPEEWAKRDRENPISMLKRYAKFFEGYENIRVANMCRSCGKKAIPLAILKKDGTFICSDFHPFVYKNHGYPEFTRKNNE